MTDELRNEYDVVVVGGGAAGLSGALVLARSRRSVVVLDAGAPRNARAAGVHGLLAREGMPPAELLERGRAEVRSYGGSVVDGAASAWLTVFGVAVVTGCVVLAVEATGVGRSRSSCCRPWSTSWS